MAHVPHLYLPGPWSGPAVDLGDEHRHHLARVLRIQPGSAVSYTDGAGTVGDGVFDGSSVTRGEEGGHGRTTLTVAVAPPHARDRARFLVEKLSELGVARIRWLDTAHGEGRPPRADRARAWAAAALEQSRGAWITEVDEALCGWDELEPPVLAAVPGGPGPPAGLDAVTVAIGPEGGWAKGEIPLGVPTLGLGERILRLETAAIVAAALLLR